MTVSGDKIFLDDVVAFATTLGTKAVPEASEVDFAATLIKSLGESHCGAILDALEGIQEQHSIFSGVIAWLECI